MRCPKFLKATTKTTKATRIVNGTATNLKMSNPQLLQVAEVPRRLATGDWRLATGKFLNPGPGKTRTAGRRMMYKEVVRKAHAAKTFEAAQIRTGQ